MASIKTILYKGKLLKDGSRPIIIQIIHERQTIRLSLGHGVEEEFWDKKTGKVLDSHRNSKALNALILQKLAEAEKMVLKLETEKEDFSIEEVQTRVRKRKPKFSFYGYTEKLIDEMKTARRFGNAKMYQYTLAAVKNYSTKPDLMFPEIDFQFLKSFESAYLSKEGNSINGISVYLRTIRAIFNRAIHEGVIESKVYPFSKFKIKSKNTLKRAISREDILKIKNVELVNDTEIWHSKNYFLFSFYAIGMSWADLAQIKVKSINNDRLFYTRMKTGKEYSIKLTEAALDIVNHYIHGKKKDDYLFPIIKRTADPLDTIKDINNSLKTHNKNLKKIAEIAGVNSNLTSYVSRHSWASIANFSGVPIGIISEGLGHNDIKTTQTYLANFEYTDIDKANELISNL